MSVRVYEGRLTIAWPRDRSDRPAIFAEKLRMTSVIGITDESWTNEDGVHLYRASLHLAHEVGALESKLEQISLMIADEKSSYGAIVTRSQSTT